MKRRLSPFLPIGLSLNVLGIALTNFWGDRLPSPWISTAIIGVGIVMILVGIILTRRKM